MQADLETSVSLPLLATISGPKGLMTPEMT
ncbi:hypothetical protein [Dickeya oryzae]